MGCRGWMNSVSCCCWRRDFSEAAVSRVEFRLMEMGMETCYSGMQGVPSARGPGLGWLWFGCAQLPRRFCHIPISPGRMTRIQTAEITSCYSRLLRGQVWRSLGNRCQQQQLLDCRSNLLFPATESFLLGRQWNNINSSKSTPHGEMGHPVCSSWTTTWIGLSGSVQTGILMFRMKRSERLLCIAYAYSCQCHLVAQLVGQVSFSRVVKHRSLCCSDQAC